LGHLFIIGEASIALEQQAYFFQPGQAGREGPQGQTKGTKASFGRRRLVEEPPLEEGLKVRQIERPEGILGGLGARRKGHEKFYFSVRGTTWQPFPRPIQTLQSPAHPSWVRGTALKAYRILPSQKVPLPVASFLADAIKSNGFLQKKVFGWGQFAVDFS